MRSLAHIRERGPKNSAAGRFGRFLGRFTVTAIAVAVASVIGWQLWIYYLEAPWTRDGRVRADVVQVAADVSGLVSEVMVHDNQAVKKGEVLIRIDPARFQIALRMRKPMSIANWPPRRRPNERRPAITGSMRSRSPRSSSNSAALRLRKRRQFTSKLSPAAMLPRSISPDPRCMRR
jgi:hypothetical protein